MAIISTREILPSSDAVGKMVENTVSHALQPVRKMYPAAVASIRHQAGGVNAISLGVMREH